MAKATLTAAKKALNKEVAEHYEVVEWPFRSVHCIAPKWGEINLKKIRLKSVAQMVKKGCPYFAAKSKETNKNSTSK